MLGAFLLVLITAIALRYATNVLDKGAVFDGSCVMGEVHPLDTGADADTDTGADTDYRDQPTRN